MIRQQLDRLASRSIDAIGYGRCLGVRAKGNVRPGSVEPESGRD